MPATVEINRWTGVGPGTKTIITGINTRANAEDAHSTAGTTNPVQIPPSGTNYSYWVCTRLAVGSTGPSGTINNLRWFSDGTNNFSGNSSVNCLGNEALTYVQATGTLGQTGLPLTTANYAGGTLTTPVDVFGLTVASPKSLAGSVSAVTNQDFGSFFVYQISVLPSALPGVTGQETFTWKYDET